MIYFAAMLFALALVQTQDGPAAPRLPQARFPAEVTSIEGKIIDVAKLAQGQPVVVVTLKATWCRVCQEQLYRIKARLSRSHCRVTFLVLSPGPREDLKKIRERIGFPFPFVEDRGLVIARSLGLQMSETEILPAMFILRSDRSVGWIQMGRGPAHFGDRELLEKLDCADLFRSAARQTEMNPRTM